MEGILDPGNISGVSVEMGVDKIPISTLHCLPRKSLSDITNTQQRQSSAFDENSKTSSLSTQDYVEKLHKDLHRVYHQLWVLSNQHSGSLSYDALFHRLRECRYCVIFENATLLRLLAEKNKIIELSGIELQKLRLNLQKLHQQNWQLAQANSHMLAELNLGKDRLKGLQHELGCTMVVLKTKNLELQEKNKPCQKTGIKERLAKCEEAAEAAEGATNPSRRCQSRRSTALNRRSLSQPVSVKEKADNKRICLRRRSSTAKSQQPEPTEDLFEIEDATFPVHPLNEDCSMSSSDSCLPNADLKSEVEEKRSEVEEKTSNRILQCRPQESRRSSIGRPLRKAAEKVCSYKEVPLNMKMRRSE